jgi:small-conductance mechanosensitive channel
MDIKTVRQVKKQTVKAGGLSKHRIWIVTYIVVAVICLAVFFLSRFKIFDILGTYRLLLQHLAMAGFCVFIVLIAAKALEALIKKKSQTRAVRYNFIRLIRLLSVLIACFIVVTFLFQNWYTAAVSLGLFSLILGFALQTPISSLIGWFYIIIRSPYKVGDRIQVGQFKGDVVEINYLDTTLWEFGGYYLTNDVPSGRLIRFPNTLVLQDEVYNYSWRKFPYIWNEIPFHVAYESDLTYVEETIKRIAKEQLGEGMAENVKTFKELVEQTPVDELEIKEYPSVNFRINANTWVEVLVTYLVEPKQASPIRSRLIKAILAEFKKEPDKVLFPKTNNR